MKYILLAATIMLLYSCSDSFINHKLKAEKIGPCSNQLLPVNMTGNINGERYEFSYCLDENFDEKNCTIVRSGDSLLVQFPSSANKNNTALFKLTLDIDAKPAYHHIKFGDLQTIEVVPTDKF